MKQSRHSVMLELIQQNDIETQEELAAMLAEKGYTVTQATVSRDIKELRLIKTANDHGVYKYVQAAKTSDIRTDDKQKTILTQSVESVTFARNLVVVRTFAGMANAAAAVMDSIAFSEVLGCIAGDDTILCVAKTDEQAELLTEKIRSLAEA